MEFLIPISLFVSVAAVMILRPITRQIGGLLEAMTQERRRDRAADLGEANDARIVSILEQMSRRLELMEERVDFTERLISTRGTESRRVTRRGAVVHPVEY